MSDITTAKKAWQDMESAWDLVDVLCSHTDGIRKKGTKYLPKYNSENSDRYLFRKKRSFLFEAFNDTLDRIVSKAFKKDVMVDLPSGLEYLESDINGKGQTITAFAKEIVRESIKNGADYIFVDYPPVEGIDNLRSENNIRPTIHRISAPNLFWWKTFKTPGGQTELEEIRYYENATMPDQDGWGEENIRQIRRYMRDKWEIWREKEKDSGEWIKADEGEHTFGRVPIIPVYGDYKDIMQGEPPLLKLAWKNIEHYQISSDLNWALYYATGVWWMAGATKEEIQKGISVGPGSVKGSENPDAKLDHKEPNGKAVELLQKRKKEIEEEMASLGSEPFMSLRVNVKATGQMQNQEKVNNDIGAWVRNAEEKLVTMIQYAGLWKGMEIDADDIDIDIVYDPTVGAGVDDFVHVKDLAKQNQISVETAIQEAQRRGILSETVDPEEEKVKAEMQMPALSSLRGER